MIRLQSPIKVMPTYGVYSLVIEDANGVIHFWLLDGTYDGFDAPAKEVP